MESRQQLVQDWVSKRTVTCGVLVRCFFTSAGFQISFMLQMFNRVCQTTFVSQMFYFFLSVQLYLLLWKERFLALYGISAYKLYQGHNKSRLLLCSTDL